MRGGVNVGLEQIATSPIPAYIAFPCRNILQNISVALAISPIQSLHIRKTARMIAGLFDYIQNL